MPVSAFGQSQVPTAPVPSTRQAIQQEQQGTPLAIDDAVKMALENNLGIQIESQVAVASSGIRMVFGEKAAANLQRLLE